MAGMYPPKGNWSWDQNGLGQQWQPFPIETFMPKDDDTVLVPHKKCPKVDDEYKKISDSDAVHKIMSDLHNKPIYKYLKDNLFEESIDYLYRGQQFWDTLKIESEHELIWPNLEKKVGDYNQDEVISALEPLAIGSYMYDWNRPFILKVRLGKLIEMLISNMNSVIRDETPEERKELYIYSTHDSILVPLMQALGPYNNQNPPYGGAILFELHKHNENNSYFVRIYYYNDTNGAPVPFQGIDGKLSFEVFETSNKKWYYSDFDKECGFEKKPSLILSEMTFMVIGIGIGIGLLGLNIFACKYIRGRKNSFRVSK